MIKKNVNYKKTVICSQSFFGCHELLLLLQYYYSFQNNKIIQYISTFFSVNYTLKHFKF